MLDQTQTQLFDLCPGKVASLPGRFGAGKPLASMGR